MKQDEEALQKIDRRSLARLLSFAKPHARGFAISTSLLIAMAVLYVIGPKIVGYAVDGGMQVVKAEEGSDALFEAERREGLNILAQCGAALTLLAVLVFFLHRYQIRMTNRTGMRVIHDLRRAVFRHIMSRSLLYFDKSRAGALTTRVTGDIETLNEFFVSGVDASLSDVVRIAFILVMLFATDWRMALAALAIVPFIVLWAYVFQRRSRILFRAVRGKVSEANAFTSEALSGVRVVQSFAKEDKVESQFKERNAELMRAHRATVWNFSWFFPGMELLAAAGQGLVLTVGYVLVTGNHIAEGGVVSSWLYLSMFIEPVRQLADRFNILQSAVAAGERIFQVLDDETALPLADAPKRIAAPRGEIRFEGVSFHYDPRKPVLDQVDFRLEAGKSLALVGPTGSGKSTIISLISRFYDPTAGRVLLDGVDLRDLDPSWLRTRVGVVLQDVFLFDGSLRDNLTLGRKDLSDAVLLHALETVQAMPVFARLGGLDGHIAERGAGLSTGERQLLSFARTLAHDPLILILDEATSHIDSDTEALLQVALSRLLVGRTSVLIAHRLSTIVQADEILVLIKGQIRERGRHAELLQLGQTYAKLYRLQFQEGTEGSGASR